MEIDLRSGEVCLLDNQPVRLNDARGLRITCTAGTIWITLTGISEDIYLHPGESWLISNDALSLVESLGGGKVRFEQAELSAPWKQLLNAVQNLLQAR